MGMSTVLGQALSGMRVTQTGIDVVSQNVANAGSVGYVARTVNNVEQSAGGDVRGARTAEIQRMLDRLVQRQLWSETAGAGYTGTRASALSAVDSMYGPPGGSSALDTLYSNFTSALQQLKSEPTNYATRSAVLDAAGALAARLNDLSAGIQDLRSQAESAIDSGVSRVNTLLDRLKEVNSKLMHATGERANPTLEDERDRIVTELSGFVDVRVNIDADNRMSIVTNAGLTLFDGANPTRLTFDARSTMTPQSLWNATPGQRSVGSIYAVDSQGGQIDVIAGKFFRSGEIAAHLELRDTTLTQMQSQLDELAAQMASALSDTPRGGAAAVSGAATGFDVDLTGLQAGNRITLDYKLTPSGQTRSFTFIRVDSAASLPLPASAAGDANNPVVGIDFSGGMASVAAQIQAAVGAGFAVSNAGSTLRILDDGAAGTTDVSGLTAFVTNPALAGSGASAVAELPFFVDGGRNNAAYTGSYDGSAQKIGFSGRIVVNPALVADRSRLVVYNTAPQTMAGDTTRPQMMYDRLTATVVRFSPATGIGSTAAAYTGTIADFTRRTVEAEGQAVENAQGLDEGQQIARSAVESRFSEEAGVNVDREMAMLIELQTAYAANARVITAAKDMLDLLMRV